MPTRLTHLDTLSANPVLQQRLAKYVVLRCVRHSRLEDLHAGIAPSSATGDYADVTVTSPFGTIPWLRLSRFDDDEMKQLMIDIVDRTYQLLHMVLNEHTGRELLNALSRQYPAPRWHAPRLTDTC